jgi:hypothetical protein
MTKDEEIEGNALAALQLSEYLFMHLVTTTSSILPKPINGSSRG